VFLRDSTYLIPIDQAVHLVCLSVFSGALLMVDLRLLGTGLTRYPVSTLARQAQPWLVGGLIGLVVTGIPQLMSLAMKEYGSSWFWWKMSFLLAAFVFTFTVRRAVVRAEETRVPGILQAAVGLVSIALWTTVAVSARMIGLS
jgi:hypothetical protein